MKLDDFVGAYRDDFAFSFDNHIILNWYPRRIIERSRPEMRVLELGVGHGYTCQLFSEYFASYTVIDASTAIINRFREQYPNSRAKLVEAYFEAFETIDQYDVIVMGFVLEHVDDPAAILRHYRQYLAPGGCCFVAVPNAESLHRRFGQAAGVLDDLFVLGAGDLALGHQRLYSVASLATEIETSGYRIVSREGIFLKPLTTGQLISLNLGPEILEGMCRVGVGYPELSAALLFEAVSAE
jgi:2-polyprenyl-3-methyl-5-hydroxy-6-metoxy-1,4-benzoquinol methylase